MQNRNLGRAFELFQEIETLAALARRNISTRKEAAAIVAANAARGSIATNLEALAVVLARAAKGRT